MSTSKRKPEMPTVNLYPPRRPSGYFDAFVQNTHAMHHSNTWIPTLNSLRHQKGYLEDLLSKTAITLNALRERQTRNERALSRNPTPRSKRKKILQNRWRTSKTIQTCEREESVILDCLRACTSNINTLEAIINSTNMSSTTMECALSTRNPESNTTSFEWCGWTDGAALSPFQKDRVRSPSMDEIPPGNPPGNDYTPPVTTKRPPLLAPRSCPGSTTPPPPVPPNTALSQFSHSTFSPEAAVFKPSVTHFPPGDEELTVELDKLSIAGLLASKRIQSMQRRRLSDAAIGHPLRPRSSSAGSAGGRLFSRQSWAATSPPRQHEEQEVVFGTVMMMRRTNSV